MADSPLLVKSKAFALEVIKACNEIKQAKYESVLANQFWRSGTSIGANINEANYGQSNVPLKCCLNTRQKATCFGKPLFIFGKWLIVFKIA